MKTLMLILASAITFQFLIHCLTPPKSWEGHIKDFWGERTPKVDYFGGMICLGLASIAWWILAFAI